MHYLLLTPTFVKDFKVMADYGRLDIFAFYLSSIDWPANRFKMSYSSILGLNGV